VEIGNIVTYSRRSRCRWWRSTSRAQSALGKRADVVLELPRVKRPARTAAPTTSTTMQLAIGDCLRDCNAGERLHRHDFGDPPGALWGASLRFVADVMHTGDRRRWPARTWR
jgi:arabinose-5-phosphate isomerase